MDEDIRSAIRNKKNSSMRIAIDLVKSGEADACVSAGNTGALMGTAKFVLKTLPGIDRPAICAALPTRNGVVYTLDLGANAECTPEHLLQFAIMGAMLCTAVEGKKNPTVGLLNIGSEDIKGNESVKAAGELLKASHLNFFGNVEGTDIYKGTTDVVVMRWLCRQRDAENLRGHGQDDGRFPQGGISERLVQQVCCCRVTCPSLSDSVTAWITVALTALPCSASRALW